MPPPDPPLAFLAELTHRCPLGCPYCSNPLEMARASAEMATRDWLRIFDEAGRLGARQVHLSGGEPTARRDLPDLVAGARAAGLYTNLITSGVMLSDDRLERLVEAGLDHVQISLQDAEAGQADRIACLPGAHARKLQAAAAVRHAGLALTLNVVVHRQNLDRLAGIIALATEVGARRLEIAHVQYHGWAFANRAALLPTPRQVRRALEIVESARAELRGRLVIDHVLPDYFAARPKACMGGWGRQFFVVTPVGDLMPCHAAATIPGMRFANARSAPLAAIWAEDEAFQRFRGTSWMPEPCASCDRREIDWGGCRCQALALAGDAAATDPACAFSPHRAALPLPAADPTSDPLPPFRPRRLAPPRSIAPPART